MDRQPTDGGVLAEDTPKAGPRPTVRGQRHLRGPTTADRLAAYKPFSSSTDGGG
jgi:hypothetical protein